MVARQELIRSLQKKSKVKMQIEESQGNQQLYNTKKRRRYSSNIISGVFEGKTTGTPIGCGWCDDS